MRIAWALVACLAVAGCGDDPKQGGKTVPAEKPAPAAVPEPTDAWGVGVTGWSSARVDDTATWEIRVPGTDTVTTLTWSVTKVDGGTVRYHVRSRTTGAGGKSLAATDVDETHDAVASPIGRDAVPETLTVAGKSVKAWKWVSGAGGDETTVWTSPDVPMSGVVKSSGPGGAEQVLVAWGRGGG